MIIEKKTWPDLFQDIMDGKKKFDIRLADFECKPGDILVLKEFDPEANKFTGRELRKKVTYVLRTKDCKFFTKDELEKYGLQAIGIE